ncbi:hypothetical protein LOB56_02615 [Lactobacillus delbrueckii subsp. lactis]|nr:hypothetical protein [Lactobacillus delbrueckii]MCD5601812.1 hypothetical protein [Lactobacillus delbrueckii subsp. lactis]
MMITETEIPEELCIKINDTDVHSFKATFDFYNTAIGLALNVKTREAATKFWLTPQDDRNDVPTNSWFEFFAMILMEALDEGMDSIPTFSFVNNSIIPVTLPSAAWACLRRNNRRRS